jgi:hypothetical protein
VLYSARPEDAALSNVVNLNKFRKRKAKTEREKQADVNRRLHGRTKVERKREDLQKERLTRVVDGARLDPNTDAANDSGEEESGTPD